MKRIYAIAVGVLLAAATTTQLAYSHCQIPCGIYDDASRIARMYEDADTIAKGMTQIADLSGKSDAQGKNQLTRWIVNKEEHANNILTTVAEYFLTQKVKTVEPGADGYDAYLLALADHHRVMTTAMKCKQSTDPQRVQDLRAAIDALAKHYDTGHRH